MIGMNQTINRTNQNQRTENRVKEGRMLIRQTEHFEQGQYQSFSEHLSSIRVSQSMVEEISIKCYGYGYFQKYQKILQQNMNHYLQDALGMCQRLKKLRVQFSGFSVGDGSLIKLFESIQKFISDKRPKQRIEIQTRMLRDCNVEDVEKSFKLLKNVMNCDQFQQINWVMSGWSFHHSPLNKNQLTKVLADFAILHTRKKHTKKVKLDISGWYMQKIQAFDLLQEFDQTNDGKNILITKMVEARTQADHRNKKQQLEHNRLVQLEGIIEKYLEQLHHKFHNENPIPGKGPHYFSIESQLTKRKMQQVEKWINQPLTIQQQEGLCNILKDSEPVPQKYKTKLKQIQNKVKQDYDIQQDQYQIMKKQIEETNKLEKQISKQFTKFPFDFVIGERVRSFHGSMRKFLEELRGSLSDLELFQFDMRNWNAMFQMGELKKTLDKDFSISGDLKLFGAALSQIASKIRGTRPPPSEEGQPQKPALKMTFVM